MPPRAATSPRVGGRQRDPQIDAAVRTATLELLDEVGYAGLSIAQIAKRAHVHRPAIYRRWPGKQELVTDVIAASIGLRATPSSGNLRRDLIAGVGTLVTAFDGTVLGHVLPALLADLSRDAELRQKFLDQIFDPRRRTSETALEQAIARGELRADIDLEFVLDALAAPVYYRVLFRHAPLDLALVEHTVDLVLAGIRR